MTREQRRGFVLVLVGLIAVVALILWVITQ